MHHGQRTLCPSVLALLTVRGFNTKNGKEKKGALDLPVPVNAEREDIPSAQSQSSFSYPITSWSTIPWIKIDRNTNTAQTPPRSPVELIFLNTDYMERADENASFN
ncbi:hypothetical protein L218DRAFT_1075217 [Marasmius fiardii PR-910]|nr:hypothetical protein L218DRAFT_1075217 [Marasmius fiardii PR-910]